VRTIYLHGFASAPSSGKAEAFRRRFEERGHTLEVPDLNTPEFETMTISSHIGLLDRLLQDEPANLIGSSLGGYLAAYYASVRPGIAKVVLLAPAFEFFDRWPRLLGEQAFAEWEATGWRDVFHYGENRTRRVHWDLVRDARQYPAAPRFSQPCLVFHGTRDDTVPADLSVRWSAGQPNVRLRLLDSDHQLTDSVEAIWQETREFLAI
jgi:pimeloyl-ACP methyl ester carboxylesterase